MHVLCCTGKSSSAPPSAMVSGAVQNTFRNLATPTDLELNGTAAVTRRRNRTKRLCEWPVSSAQTQKGFHVVASDEGELWCAAAATSKGGRPPSKSDRTREQTEFANCQIVMTTSFASAVVTLLLSSHTCRRTQLATSTRWS